MARSSFLFTSESVSEGHPDKVADQISDAIVDLFLSKDPEARVACETLTTTNLVVLAGEIRGKGIMDVDGQWAPGVKDEIEATVRKVVRDIGYEQDGFHWEKLAFENHLHPQSAHIAQGVDASADKDEGAGDQGIMFGYASNETPELMPATLQYSHNILKKLAEARHAGKEPKLEPDAKSQVTLFYENGRPVRATSIVLSTQHAPGLSSDDVAAIVKPYIREVLPDGFITNETEWHVNPTGSFEIGGPDGDAGVTGRKIIVDTYGGKGAHGGGAFSGKDPSKVDRSAAYATRHIAKNLVAAGICDEVLVQVSYAIGVAKPMGVYVNTYGTAKVNMTDGEISRIVEEVFDMRPYFIEQRLKLRQPMYSECAAYGHMGRQSETVTKSFKSADGKTKSVKVELFTWEKLDYVKKVKAAFSAKK